MPPVPTPPPLGKNIMAIRKEQGLSLDELARRSGVSKAMLSQVEQHKTNPTIATLWKIAYGLDAGLEQLLGREGSPREVVSVNRRDEAVHLPSRDGKVDVQICSWLDMVEDLEMYYLHFEPGGAVDSEAHFAKTEEIATVIKGQFRVGAGGHEVTIKAGDTARYPADRQHVIQNLSRGKGELFLVVHFRRETS